MARGPQKAIDRVGQIASQLLHPRAVRLRVDRCGKFGPDYARRLKRRQGRLGDTWFLDEVFVTINGQRQYLWRAVDQDGDLIDLLVQPRRDGRAARRFSDNSCRVSDRNRCGS